MKKIKVVFETGLIGDLHYNQAGLYRVADELFKRFYKNDEIDLFYAVFAHKRSKTTTYDIEKIFAEKNYNISPVNSRKRIKFLPFRKEKLFKFFYKKLNIEDYRIINFKELNQVEIYHSIYYPVPKILTKYPNLKKVVTIHDLIPFIFPNYNSDKILMEEIIRNVEKDGYVICVSECTKRDLIKFAPQINPNNIFVSLLAADPKKFYVCKSPEKLSCISSKYNFPQRYFLGLSTLEPRKNIDHVIKCFIKFVKEHDIQDLSLVLVGSKGWDFDNIFKEYDAAQDLKDKIIITGRIPDEDLATIYSNAEAFFYMSFYEGFGLPPLEAMQCGTATVVSNVSSLPEVVGDAGVLLDPKNQAQLIEEMWKLYSDEDYRNDLGNRALERSKCFSWDKTVAEHINIYKKILHF